MAQVSLRSTIIPTIGLIILLFATGVFTYQKPDYKCLDGKAEWQWRDKVELFSYKSFQVSGYQLINYCASEYRYDAETGLLCGLSCSVGETGKDSVYEQSAGN